jgi:hypothetical protein
MKTINSIISEFEKTYVKDPSRRTARSFCSAYTLIDKNGDTSHCAIGRYLKPELQSMEWKYNGDGISYIMRVEELDNIDSILKEEYHNIPMQFWTDMQSLHDNNSFWTAAGLNDRGQELLDHMKEKDYNRKPLREALKRKDVSGNVILFRDE